jgi:hypothetical protein
MFKVKIPSVTYINDEDTASPTIETLSAVEVAKVLEENIGVRIVGSASRPNREDNVNIIHSRDIVATATKPATEQPSEASETKPKRLQRFTSFIKRTIDEAATEPHRPNPFSEKLKPAISQGIIRFIKENEKPVPYFFLSKPMLAKMEMLQSSEQSSRDLCDFLVTLTDDEQKLVCGALEKLLGISVTKESLYTANELITEHVATRYEDKPDAFEAFLNDFKKEDLGSERPMERYHRPLHELGSTLKDMIQNAMDLSDAEKEAIVFDISSFTKDPCKVKLPAVMYSRPEILKGEDDTQTVVMTSKSYSPEEVTSALHNEFDITVEQLEIAAGSAAKASKHIKRGGAKGGR